MFITTFVINKTEFQLPAIRKPTHEAGASTKRKKFRCPTTWENSGLLSQRPSQNPPAQAQGPYKDREGSDFFLSNNLSSFWHTWGPFCLYSSFPCVQALSIHIPSFWHLYVRTSPRHILTSGGDSWQSHCLLQLCFKLPVQSRN